MINIFHILLIGAGEIGSRHLQALAKSELKIKITVIEPNIKASIRAKEKFFEMPPNANIDSINFLNSVNDINSNIDIAILATNSNVRRKVIEDLLQKVNVSYFLLEKIVFQNIDDFIIVKEIFDKKKIQSWVNCTRRIWPIFEKIKLELINRKNISLIVRGNDWGMGSNAIHMLDIFGFIRNNNEIFVNYYNLDKKIYESKRNGFVEFKGEIEFTNKLGDNLIITDKPNESKSSLMEIQTEQEIIKINQEDKKITWINKSNYKKSELSIEIPFQSDLTHIIVKDILETGKSKLTKLDESALYHEHLFQIFNEHLSSIYNKKYIFCPIT